jgi:hypothetical protein
MDPQQLVVALVRAAYETVVEAGSHGAPCGVMYLAFMERGISLDTWNVIKRALLRLGVTKVCHVLYAPGYAP